MENEKTEYEEMTAKFLGRVREGVRYVYQFENPTNPEYKPMKISAFDAKPDAQVKNDAPKLDEGKYYTFTVEHVPTKDDPTKRHHNFARNGFNGPYMIEPANKASEDGIKTGYEIAKKQASRQPSNDEIPQELDKLGYWDKKDARDIARENKYNLSLKYINAVAMMPAVGYIIGGMLQHKEGYDGVTKAGFGTTARLILAELEEVAETRLPPEVAYANRKDKKGPIEADLG